MMLTGPLLISLIPGLIIILVTWWFKKMEFPLFVRIAPGILAIITAVVLFYIGFVNIRGFEGSAYGILAILLVLYAAISFIIAKKSTTQSI